MSVWERIFHMVLFEALAVLLSVAGLWLLTDYHVVALSGMVVAISLIAMGWNFCLTGCLTIMCLAKECCAVGKCGFGM